MQSLKIKQAEKFTQRLIAAKQALEVESKIQIQLLRTRQQLANLREKTQIRIQGLQSLRVELGLAEELRKKRVELRQLEGFIVRDRGQAALAAAKQATLQAKAIEENLKRLRQERELSQNQRDRGLLTTQIQQQERLLGLSQQRVSLLATEWITRSQAARLEDEQYRLEQQRTALQQQTTVAEAQARLVNLQSQLKGGQAEVASRAQVRALNAQILEQEASLVSLRRQSGLLAEGSQRRTQLNTEISHRTQILELRRQELGLVKEQVKQEEARRTTLGAFVSTLKEQALNLQAQVGQQLANSFLSLTQSLTTAMGQLFTDMIIQPEAALSNFGKTILSALGDLALSFAGVFAAKAIGFAVLPGGQPIAAGLAAASLGLTFLGGLLKAGSALVGQNVPSPSASGGGGSGIAQQTSVPGQSLPREERPLVILNNINSVPWRRQQNTSPSEYREMSRWAEREARNTGLRFGGLG